MILQTPSSSFALKPAIAIAALSLVSGGAFAQLPPGDGPLTVSINVTEASPTKFEETLLSQLKVPPGFRISIFAKGLANVRWLLPMPNGDVYVSRRDQGDVLLLRDTNRDGVADEKKTVAQNLKFAHGLAQREGKLYITSDKKVLVADIQPDGSLSTPRVIIDDLPDAGQHPNRTIGFGPDGMLYITAGSTCNDCRDSNPESATMLRAQPDGSARSVFARGLRNTIGFGWHPLSGVLYGFDNGSDYHGDDLPPEELNAILVNKHYGWPFCYADRQVDAQVFNDPPNSTKGDFCPTTEGSLLTYTAHAAPIGFTFYTGAQFPSEYRNDAFVAFRGSWNRAQPSGFRVVRVRFDQTGKPLATEDFATGWLMASPPPSLLQPGVAAPATEQAKARRPAQFGRLAGLAVAADGALLIAEDQNGVIYRVSTVAGDLQDDTMHSPLAPRAFWLAPALLASVLTACGLPSPTVKTDTHAGHALSGQSPSNTAAVAELVTVTGEAAGRAEFAQTATGVEITIRVRGLSPGEHGFHIHSHGECASGPDPTTGKTVAFGAAGGHFDPGSSRNHGQPGQAAHEAHAGELPNITVASDGTGTLRYVNTQVTLPPSKGSVLGRTLVVHENADDYVTDPAGNSGGRLLCGLIEPATRGLVVDRVTIDGSNAYPEGIAVDSRTGTAYVGSSSEGHIWRISAGSKKAELLQSGGAFGRQAAYGIKLDAAGRLWIAGGATGTVAIVEPTTASTVAVLKTPPGSHTFINDMVLAADGNAYVTDSFRPILFKARHASGTVPAGLEPWLDLAATPIRYVPNQINLNGIVSSPDGKWLLAIQLVTGQLWRIDTGSKAVVEVRIEGGDLRNGDGLVLQGNDLYVLRNENNEIVRLALADGWSNARLVERITDPRLKFPTTAAFSRNGLMVVSGQLNKIKEPPPLLPFDVFTLRFPIN